MGRVVECRLPVGDGRSTAATVFWPDDVPERPVVAFGFPGGGYSRGYYDIRHDDGAYSQAAYHVDRGWIFVACDHLGVPQGSVRATVLI